MGIDQRNGVIKGGRTRKKDEGDIRSASDFTLYWEVNNLTAAKGTKKRRIWFQLQQRGWREDPIVPAAAMGWQEVVAKTELCRGQGASGTIDMLPTVGDGARSSERIERFPEFRFVITRKSGSGKRNYCVYADLVPKS